jgi:hypothetical protein
MKSGFVFLIGCLAMFTPLRAAQSARPNILLLFADDQRADTIHALGNKTTTAGGLDRHRLT